MGKDAIGPHWRHRKINTLCHIHKKRPVEKLELLDRPNTTILGQIDVRYAR